MGTFITLGDGEADPRVWGGSGGRFGIIVLARPECGVLPLDLGESREGKKKGGSQIEPQDPTSPQKPKDDPPTQPHLCHKAQHVLLGDLFGCPQPPLVLEFGGICQGDWGDLQVPAKWRYVCLTPPKYFGAPQGCVSNTPQPCDRPFKSLGVGGLCCFLFFLCGVV